MELTNNAYPDAIRVYQSPTLQERLAMQTGKCILLREFSGIVPINIALTLPTHTELRGFIDGDLQARLDVPYPNPFLSKHMAYFVYAQRVERAATEISTYLECL